MLTFLARTRNLIIDLDSANGNIFVIIGIARRLMLDEGCSASEIATMQRVVCSASDYESALAAVQMFVDVDYWRHDAPFDPSDSPSRPQGEVEMVIEIYPTKTGRTAATATERKAAPLKRAKAASPAKLAVSVKSKTAAAARTRVRRGAG